MAFTGLELVGLFALAALFFFCLRKAFGFLYTSYLGYKLGRTVKVNKFGEWAVITGATDGIGKAYAEELARIGMNVVLISRTEGKLQRVAAEIEEKYAVKTKILPVDFTGGVEIYEKVGAELQRLDIGVLINNVGMSYTHPEFFVEASMQKDFCKNLLNCNILSVVMMTTLVLPAMVQKKKGFILNVGSASALFPTPLLALYASTKAFVQKFSDDLSLECQGSRVIVQCVLPGFVATNMTRIAKTSLTVPNPNQFVKSHIKTFGLETCSPGYWAHKIQFGLYGLAQLFFRPVVERVSWYGMLSVRKRALRRIKPGYSNGKVVSGSERLAEQLVGCANADPTKVD